MPNRAGHSIDPWGTLLATGLQVDIMPLSTALWTGADKLNEDLTGGRVKEFSAL